jgi:hypothetical protein
MVYADPPVDIFYHPFRNRIASGSEHVGNLPLDQANVITDMKDEQDEDIKAKKLIQGRDCMV